MSMSLQGGPTSLCPPSPLTRLANRCGRVYFVTHPHLRHRESTFRGPKRQCYDIRCARFSFKLYSHDQLNHGWLAGRQFKILKFFNLFAYIPLGKVLKILRKTHGWVKLSVWLNETFLNILSCRQLSKERHFHTFFYISQAYLPFFL